MRFNWAAGLLVVLATSEAVGASNWFTKSGNGNSVFRRNSVPLTEPTVYNSWHETELERWLADHGRLRPFSCSASVHVANSSTDIPYPTPADRKDLEKLVKANWHDKVQVPLARTSESATDHLSNVKEWIFDR